MYLDDQLSEKDQTEEQFGVRLVIDKMSVPYLSRGQIDFVDSPRGLRLHDRQPRRAELLRLRELLPLASRAGEGALVRVVREVRSEPALGLAPVHPAPPRVVLDLILAEAADVEVPRRGCAKYKPAHARGRGHRVRAR